MPVSPDGAKIRRARQTRNVWNKRGEPQRRPFFRIGWPLIRAFCAENGPVDRPERVFGTQFFSLFGGPRIEHRLACTRVSQRVARATMMPTPTVIRHRKNPHFIDISVMREN